MQATKKPLADLAYFTGTEDWHRYSIAPFTLTDGVKYVADEAGAYWLVDIVMSWQFDERVAREPFQVWKLVLDSTGTGATVYCEDGNGNEIRVKSSEIGLPQKIGFTDFPLPEITLWLTDNVLMLPSEY